MENARDVWKTCAIQIEIRRSAVFVVVVVIAVDVIIVMVVIVMDGGVDVCMFNVTCV